MKSVRVQPEDFDPGFEMAALGALGSGGVASFVGHVRGDGELIALTLEHYPQMTARALDDLAEQALARWALDGVTLIHRIGRLVPGDRIVLVCTASRHRAAALEACAYLIDRLKTDAPFWKKEEFSDGRSSWVEARQSDDAAAERWG
ncbi:MAG: molybdenum cofactor biosynthesis protein MoaE [Sphingomonadaceae bacterium]|jgi:molybdopterin synthase catalytic subunit